MRVELNGRGRYHKVSQSCSDDGICVAVNYWYVIVHFSHESLSKGNFPSSSRRSFRATPSLLG